MPTIEQLKKQFLELGILTLLTVIVWIGYSIYIALTQPSQTQVTKKELEPVPTTLNIELLESLSQREGVSDKDLEEYSLNLGLREASPSAPSFPVNELPSEVVEYTEPSTSSAQPLP